MKMFSLKMCQMQGPDPSLAYRPNLEKNKTKEIKDYRNFEVSFQTHFSANDNYLMLYTVYL